jgi:hypothetical protein
MNEQDKEEFAKLFKKLWEKPFDVLFYELKSRGFTIIKMETEPYSRFTEYEQQPYIITVRFQDKNCNEERITFYGAFPKECLTVAMKDYQILSFNFGTLKQKVKLT